MMDTEEKELEALSAQAAEAAPADPEQPTPPASAAAEEMSDASAAAAPSDGVRDEEAGAPAEPGAVDAEGDADAAAGEADPAFADAGPEDGDASGDADSGGGAPAAPTNDEIARIAELFQRSEAADGALSGFQFARWTRPLCPQVFGTDAAGAEAMVSGVRDAAKLAGLELVEEDPEFGANILFFFCSEWAELKQTPSLDRLIPDLDKLVVLLAAAGANQYRIFSFSPDAGPKLAVVLIRYDADLGKMSPSALALGQAVQTLLLWSDTAFTRESPIDAGWRRGRSGRDRRPRVTRWFTALLKSAYGAEAPAYSDDPALAGRLAEAVARELEGSARGRRGDEPRKRGRRVRAGASEQAASSDAAEAADALDGAEAPAPDLTGDLAPDSAPELAAPSVSDDVAAPSASVADAPLSEDAGEAAAVAEAPAETGETDAAASADAPRATETGALDDPAR